MKTFCPHCDAQTERVLFLTVRVPYRWGNMAEPLEQIAEKAIGLGKYELDADTFWGTSCDVCGEKYSEAWRNGFEDYARYGDTLSLAEVWASRGGNPPESSEWWDRDAYEEYADGWRIGIADRDEPLMGWDF